MIKGRAIAIDDKDPDADYSVEFEAMVARMQAWASQMDDWFPTGPIREDKGYDHYKIPVESWLVAPPIATDAVYARCANAILAAAVNLAKAKPERFQLARVAAIIGHPDMFGSEVCVFFDPQYWRTFAARDSEDDRWRALPAECSLSARLGIAVPSGFIEQGYATWWRDDTFDPPYEVSNETWIYAELLPSDNP